MESVFKSIAMKTTFSFFSLILFIGIFNQLQAQPVPQPADLAPPGTTRILRHVTSSLTPLTLGANVTWDLSSVSLGPIDTSITASIVTVASTPYADSFPSSNYCTKVKHGSDIFYAFSHYDSTKLEELVNGYTDSGALINYVLPKMVMKFPFNYGDSMIVPYQELGQPVDTIKLYYQAFGTFKTPLQTYTDVMLIKTVDNNGPKQMLWSTNPLGPLFQFDDAIWFQTIATSIADIDANVLQSASLSPNPSVGKPIVTYTIADNANVTITISDVAGLKAAQLYSGKTTKGTHQLTIDDNHLAAGIYLINIQVGNKNELLRYLKAN